VVGAPPFWPANPRNRRLALSLTPRIYTSGALQSRILGRMFILSMHSRENKVESSNVCHEHPARPASYAPSVRQSPVGSNSYLPLAFMFRWRSAAFPTSLSGWGNPHMLCLRPADPVILPTNSGVRTKDMLQVKNACCCLLPCP
jgi:hypothetical protein